MGAVVVIDIAGIGMSKKKTLISAGIIVVLAILFWQLFLRDISLTGDAKLSWNATAEQDIKGYKIYYGAEKRTGDCPQGGYTKKVDAGNKTAYKLENLKDGVTYYFSVTSYNSGGKESCFSQEMSKTVKLSFFDKLKAFLKK